MPYSISNIQPLHISALSISVSIVALVIAIKGYSRKSGTFIRGVFTTCTSISCDDEYITNIVLENLKDRAVTIFSIYLKLGHSYYIEVDNLEDNPLILRAFETFQKEYGPIEFYGINTHKIDLATLFRDPKIPKRLVLSTSDGKYVVPSRINRWDPVYDFFRNHLTACIKTVRSDYKGLSIGGSIRYIVEITFENGKEEIFQLREDNYKFKIFRHFDLTRDALSGKDELLSFLNSKIEAGVLPCASVTVVDLAELRPNKFEFYNGEPIKAEYYNYFKYYACGRIATALSNWKMRKKNKQILRKSNKRDN